jgi:dethiobiotin synthetase
MAAAALDLAPPTLAELVAETAASWPDPPAGVGLVEGAGGVASPLAADGDSADLARALDADLVVLVADAGLGTISAVRLAVAHLQPLPTVVYLNRFSPGDALHAANRAWLRERCGLSVHTTADEVAALVAAR